MHTSKFHCLCSVAYRKLDAIRCLHHAQLVVSDHCCCCQHFMPEKSLLSTTRTHTNPLVLILLQGTCASSKQDSSNRTLSPSPTSKGNSLRVSGPSQVTRLKQEQHPEPRASVTTMDRFRWLVMAHLDPSLWVLLGLNSPIQVCALPLLHHPGLCTAVSHSTARQKSMIGMCQVAMHHISLALSVLHWLGKPARAGEVHQWCTLALSWQGALTLAQCSGCICKIRLSLPLA